MSTIELTDITSVRQFMQKSVSDKLQDEDLEILIRQVSEEVQRYCRREFLPASGSLTRSFEFLSNTAWDLLDVTPYELKTVTGVTVDPDLTPVALTATQYRLFPYPSVDGTFYGLRFAELPEPTVPSSFSASPMFPYQTRRVDVTGTWGLGSVPQGLQHWCNLAVEQWVQLRRGMVMGAETNLGEGPMPVIDDLPVPVKRALRRWERPTMVASA